jgi:hypothetical protein
MAAVESGGSGCHKTADRRGLAVRPVWAARCSVGCWTEKLGFKMKGIIAIGVAAALLWLADIQFNDGRYSNVVETAIVSLIGK